MRDTPRPLEVYTPSSSLSQTSEHGSWNFLPRFINAPLALGILKCPGKPLPSHQDKIRTVSSCPGLSVHLQNSIPQKANVQESEPEGPNPLCIPTSVIDLLRPQQGQASSPEILYQEVGRGWQPDISVFPFDLSKRGGYQRSRFPDFKTNKP